LDIAKLNGSILNCYTNKPLTKKRDVSTSLDMTARMVPAVGSCRLPFVKLAFARIPQEDDEI
jgi:hypothetical protein